MGTAFEFTLNGKKVRVEGHSPNTTVLDFLRTQGWTGSKEGCAEGDCGACTIAIVEQNAKGEPCYRAVNSCIMLLPMLAGREVVTVEGLKCQRPDQSLHPVQEAMVVNHGSQCGYCTPGFIMSLFEGYYRKNLKEHWQIEHQLCGNLCRCTGYRPIKDAAIEVLKGKKKNEPDPFEKRLEQPVLPLTRFDYEAEERAFWRPGDLSELFELMKKHPDARLIAGGTELGVDIAKSFKRYPKLISLEGVRELKEISNTDEEWFFGGATTLTEIDEALGKELRPLTRMFEVFASRQICNRATLGGNLVNASPIGDTAPVLLTVDTKLVLASAQGERVVPLTDFFIGYRKTVLQAGEVLKTIIVPRKALTPGAVKSITDSYKVSKRREMDISTVASGFRVDLDANDIIIEARLAYGGVAITPIRARQTEKELIGQPWNHETIRKVLPILREEFSPITDFRGTAEYRKEVVTGLFEKFFFGEHFELNQTEIVNLPSTPAHTERPLPHESGHKHVSGEAVYVDDEAMSPGFLEVWPVCSPHAHAKILKRDISVARTMPGIATVLLAEDVPGMNDVGAVRHDEILLADKEVLYHGHLVALVVGRTQEECRAAAEKVVVEYEPLKPIIDVKEAVELNLFHTDPHVMTRGNFSKEFDQALNTFEGEFSFGGQEHFYLETHAAWAKPGEDGEVFVSSSTQHPSEIQTVVAHVLGVSKNKVTVESPRMGGGFGGKETQGNTPAALAALAASKTGRPVRVRFNREQDMILTGKRHPFYAKFKVGHDKDGKILAIKVDLFANGGWSLDLSQPVADRALFHLDNSYYLPNVELSSRVVKTHVASNTAFRGFGGPQGMLTIEEIMDRVARHTNLLPEVVRERNLYYGKGETNTTHYGEEIEDNRLQTIWHELKQTANLEKRRKEIEKWNASQPNRKRGIAITPVKFGISFTLTHMNQAGAFVVIYQDGSVQVNHGGTEMGQGLYTKMIAVASKELGVKKSNIRLMRTRTDKVPNTSPTAASSGSDLNGQAVKNACLTLKERLLPVATKLLEQKLKQKISEAEIIFEEGNVFAKKSPKELVSFAAVTQQAYFDRVSLSATGYYATPGIHMNWETGKGKPFLYYACGAAVTEVEVDKFTGMNRLLRVDILHDVGSSINEGVDRGQVEGGFVQGMGWLTREELKWDDKGKLLTKCASTYAIPSIGDAPVEFNVHFLKNAVQHNTIHGSKAVGEPPLMLAISVREAIRDAVAAFVVPTTGEILLPSPATNEAIAMTIRSLSPKVSQEKTKKNPIPTQKPAAALTSS